MLGGSSKHCVWIRDVISSFVKYVMPKVQHSKQPLPYDNANSAIDRVYS